MKNLNRLENSQLLDAMSKTIFTEEQCDDAWLLYSQRTREAIEMMESSVRLEVLSLAMNLGNAVSKLAQPPPMRIDATQDGLGWRVKASLLGESAGETTSKSFPDALCDVIVSLATECKPKGNASETVSVARTWSAALRRASFRVETDTWNEFANWAKELPDSKPERKDDGKQG